MTENLKGLFIAFEGGEGSGKSTQAAMLCDALFQRNITTHLTKEPGDTDLGRRLRGILLDPNIKVYSKKAEALLFAADRAEHIATVIRPRLERGDVVICDRYIASSVAYQAFAGGLSRRMVTQISDWEAGGLRPDMTFFLDIDPELGLKRARAGKKSDRYEAEDVAFHDKVRFGFLRQSNQASWARLDATLPMEELHNEIFNQTMHVLKNREMYHEAPPSVYDYTLPPQKTLCNVMEHHYPRHPHGQRDEEIIQNLLDDAKNILLERIDQLRSILREQNKVNER